MLLLPAGLKFRKIQGVIDSLHLFRHFWTIPSTLVRWPFYLYARMQDVDHEVEILKGGVVHLEKMFCGSWDYPLAQSPQSSLGEYQFIIFMLVLLVPIFKIHGSVLFTVNKNLTQKITISRVIPQNRVHFDVIQCLCMVFRSLFVDCWWFHSMFAFESLTQKQAEFRGTCFKWFLRGGSRTSSLGSSGFTIITLLLHGENQLPIHWQVLWIKWLWCPKPRNPWKFSMSSSWKMPFFFFELILAIFVWRGGGGQRRRRCDPHRLGQPGATRFYVDESMNQSEKKQNQSYVKFVFLYFNT